MTADNAVLLPTVAANGAALFTVVEDALRPGAYPAATVAIRYTPNKDASALWASGENSGPGIYGCFWRGELFYIGTYAGEDTNLRSGNVAAERWWKHVEGMTFRSRRIGIAASRLQWIVDRHDSPLASLMKRGDHARLTKRGGNGIQVQYNKFLFADRNWNDFARLDQGMMADFDFVYIRPSLTGSLTEITKEQLDPHLRAIEKRAISALKPICNGANVEWGEPSTIGQSAAVIEQLMTEQIAGWTSGNVAYQLKPRKRRSFSRKAANERATAVHSVT